MRLIVKASETDDAKLVAKVFYKEVNNITAFTVVELVLGDTDDISVTDAHALINVDMRNDFIREHDEKAIRFLIAQKIFLANIKKMDIREPFIEEVMANKMLAKAGYGDLLVYYYYSLVPRMHKDMGFEEFMLLNIPWLSLHGIDDYDAQFFLSLKSKFSYKKNYERDTAELFELLKGEIKGAVVEKALRLYRGLYAGYQI